MDILVTIAALVLLGVAAAFIYATAKAAFDGLTAKDRKPAALEAMSRRFVDEFDGSPAVAFRLRSTQAYVKRPDVIEAAAARGYVHHGTTKDGLDWVMSFSLAGG